jgi:hypothetical protein
MKLKLCSLALCALILSAASMPQDMTTSDARYSIPVNWRASENVPKLDNGFMYVYPVQCASGAPVLRSVTLDEQKRPNLDAILIMSHDGPALVDVHQANTVKDAHVVSFFATSSDIVVLVEGTDEVKLESQHIQVRPREEGSTAPIQFDRQQNIAEQHKYVLHFDLKGKLKSSNKLEQDFDAVLVGEFETGKLLLGGISRDGDIVWAVADADGTVRTLVTFPDQAKTLAAAAKYSRLENSNAPRADVTLRTMQIVASGEKLAAILQGKHLPIYLINDGGAVQTIRANLPSNVEQDYAVPSPTGLYLRGYEVDPDTRQQKKGAIYSIDAVSGTVIQTFNAGDVPIAGVVCRSEDGFLAIRHDDKGVTSLITGSPRRQ